MEIAFDFGKDLAIEKEYLIHNNSLNSNCQFNG
jgi:hypothetical protein